MAPIGFRYWGGGALILGGAATIIVGVLTVLIPPDDAFETVAASTLFVVRQSVSLVSAVCLVIGLPALYVGRHEKLGGVGALAYVVALVGTVFLAAQEWAEIFLIHDIAVRYPGVLAGLEGGDPPTLYDVSAVAAFGAFSIGWLFLCAMIIFTRAMPRWIGVLVIAGFFAAPLLAGVFQASLQQPALGAAIGNAILGLSWIAMGIEVAKPSR